MRLPAAVREAEDQQSSNRCIEAELSKRVWVHVERSRFNLILEQSRNQSGGRRWHRRQPQGWGGQQSRLWTCHSPTSTKPERCSLIFQKWKTLIDVTDGKYINIPQDFGRHYPVCFQRLLHTMWSHQHSTGCNRVQPISTISTTSTSLIAIQIDVFNKTRQEFI